MQPSQRRLKTQFFLEMDEISSKKINEGVLILAATNTPQSLDSAFLRRFGKLIYIPLPDSKARKQMFDHLLINDDEDSPKSINQDELQELCRITKG